ncbi:MAG: sulfite exporter TauE/SafE family protein [Gemmatimonadaceae bacterium]|nr:sulfite exporter TauE/SafE family protein [Gemmatimonadaceae bacterium]
MIVVGYVLATLVGLSLGLMGGGGSIMTVPIFVYVLGYDPKLAIAMSLPVVGVTSLVGAAGHWRAGNVNLKAAVTFGVIAMIGAFGGARLARLLIGEVQLALLAIVMLLASILMFRSAKAAPAAATEPHTPRGNGAADATIDTTRTMPLVLLLPVALSVGVLTGLVGIGGGFLVVPALVLLAGAPMKQAVGTSLLVIAMNSAAGFAGYLGHVTVPWSFMAGFTACAVAGVLAGAYLVRFISQKVLKQTFAVFLILMGSFILYRSRTVFFPPRDVGHVTTHRTAEPEATVASAD